MYFDLGAASCTRQGDQQLPRINDEIGSNITLSFVAPLTDFSNPPGMSVKVAELVPKPSAIQGKKGMQALEKQTVEGDWRTCSRYQ